MRNIEERLNVVKKRAQQLEQQERRRNFCILSLSCALGCILLIVGSSLALPTVMARLPMAEFTDAVGFASIFSSGSAMGYILIALLGFALGICLTIFCIYLHKRIVEDKKND
ncbi:MAG: DUF4179 domain-containing protein [Oscillospiraceae bacterium]